VEVEVEGRFEDERKRGGRGVCPAMARAGLSVSPLVGEHTKTTVGKLCNGLVSSSQTAEWKRVFRKSKTVCGLPTGEAVRK
jgi:hypothetical protein